MKMPEVQATVYEEVKQQEAEPALYQTALDITQMEPAVTQEE